MAPELVSVMEKRRPRTRPENKKESRMTVRKESKMRSSRIRIGTLNRVIRDKKELNGWTTCSRS